MGLIGTRRALLGRRARGPVIGLEWNQSTDTWTRINQDGNAHPWQQSDFDRHPIWGAITRVNLAADGTENASYGGAGYAEDGTNGRVMVRVPRFWVKAESPEANVYRWWVSLRARAGFEIHPAFYQRDHVGDPLDYIYVGAYEADGYDDAGTFKLHSRGGQQPVTGGVSYPDLPNAGRLHIDDAEDYANNIGTGWGISNVWTRQAILLLMSLEWGNLDSQAELGRGIVDKVSGSGFAGENTGSFNINSNLDSQLTGAGDDGLAGQAQDGLRPIAWRGLENFWGNAWEFVIGYNALDAEYRIIKKAGVASATMDGAIGAGDYDASAAVPLTNNGYIDGLEWEDLLEYLFVPSSSGGSDSTYIPDYFWAHDSGEMNILRAGGSWSIGSRGGVGAWGGYDVVSYSSRAVGARLEWLG